MQEKKLLLIVNPCSGKARMKNELLGVTDVFSAAGYTVTVYPTKSRGDATLYTAAITPGSYDLLVVCGGDGTLNEVISGLMQSGLDIPIGYIPSGTLNEWSSGLGISRVIQTAAQDIVSGREIILDIGKFGGKYFTYTASFGAFTSASYSAPQDVKNMLGQAAYFFEGVKSLGNIKPIPMRIEADDRTMEGEFLFGAVSNSFSVGGIVKFNETTVKLNDGLFEVLLLHNPTNILKLQPMIDGILRQEFNREGMEFFHSKRIKITAAEANDWTLDGEHAVASHETEILNIHNAVRFIVPDKK